MRKSMKSLMLVFLSLCMMLSLLCINVAAGEETNVIKDVGDGVLQLEMVYVDDKGVAHNIKTGSCFMLNEKTVLTNMSLITLNYNDKNRLKENLDVDYDANPTKVSKNIKYKVIVRRDVKIEASLIENLRSPNVDFAVLNLQQQIQGRSPLVLADSDKVRETDTVYSMGFPMIPAGAEDVPLYTKDNIDIQAGIISKVTEVGEVPVFQHSALLAEGTYGGPLVNDKGYIVGLNSIRMTAMTIAGYTGDEDEVYDNLKTQGYYYAVQINEIKDYLDDFGIVYIDEDDIQEPTEKPTEEPTEKPTEEPTEKPTEEPTEKIAETEPPVDEELIKAREDLEDAVDDADAVKLSKDKYSEESYNVFVTALENAEDVLDDENAIKSNLNKALDKLEDAKANLAEKKVDTQMIIIIAIAAVVLLIVIIIIVLLVKSSGKKNKDRGNGPSTQPINSGAQRTVPDQRSVQPPYNSNSGETTTLDGSETALLGGESAPGNACLIRRKTGEKAVITSTHFTIGREMGNVNYCITDNNTVGRVHAVIVKRGSEYAIVDQKSKNGTYVNNERLNPGQEKYLKNGDTIKLSDEILEFVLR